MNKNTNMAQRYEREIPEGYEARIEGNKVVIELKESEDEMIRKEIIDWMRGGNTYDWQENKGRWIAYLEKQKDLKYSEEDMEEIRLYAYNKGLVDEKEKYEKEQKPLNFYVPEGVDINSPKSKIAIILGQYKTMGFISEKEYLSLLKYLGESGQNPAEWSEEDENMLSNTILSLQSLVDEDLNMHFIKGVKKEIAWLKSLRPTKQGGWRHYIWNVNMRFDYDALVKYENNNGFEIVAAGSKPQKELNGEYILIKDITVQPHWKPSEEQMEALDWQIKNTYEGSWQHKATKKLFDDLKKYSLCSS